MKTIYIKPANEDVIPFLKQLLSNPAWVADITVYDDIQGEQMPFLCSADELNESLRRMEEELSQGITGGLTSAQINLSTCTATACLVENPDIVKK
ncbi:MAG: hypothetical protein LBC19_08855 [Tannerella sp.]|jgi:hypothetical protein|nr:hypothetical protein [Tannerella sp.]